MKFSTFFLLFLMLLSTLNAQITLDIVCLRESESATLIPGTECIVGFDETSGPVLNEFSDSMAVGKFLADIISDLHARAFLAASVDSVVYTGGKAKAWVHTGLQYEIIYVSLDQIDDRVLRDVNIQRGRYENRALSFEEFRQLQNKILNYFENSGYPFASVALTDTEIHGQSIRGKLKIEKNTLFYFDNIHIYGESPVNLKHLYRHIGIHPGDIYSEKKFKNSGELIRETSFMTEIRAAEMEFMKGSADLYLYPGPLKASNFSGILGILQGGKENKTRLAGELNLGLVNVFRRMESIRLQWQSPGSNIQQMDIEIGQPYLFSRAFGIDFHMNLFRQDSTYMKVEAEAGVPFSLPRGVIRAYVKVTGSSLIEGAGHVAGINAHAAEISGQIFGISYYHNRIDNRINPFRGWMVNTSAGAGNKTVNSQAGNNMNSEKTRTGFGEGMVNIRLFTPMTGSTTLLLANISGIRMNFAGDKEGDYFFVNEMFLLGGIQSIRGFDERSLAASAFSIQRIEYRYLFEEASNIFLFFDAMAYQRKLPDSVSSDIPFGFGAGLNFDTRAGQFSISYAVGSQMGNPLLLRTAKVHMGIVNRF